MNDGETQELRFQQHEELQRAINLPETDPSQVVHGFDWRAAPPEWDVTVSRFADPALGATPRRVHSVRNADLARLTWRLAIMVLVLCAAVMAGGITLEVLLYRMIP
jgi:hypothetical protein